MECVFGLVGDGFTIIVADTSAVHSILVHKSDEDKVMILDSHKLLGASGEPGDRVQFTEYIQKNVHLYQFRNGIPLTTKAVANFTRGELAGALRKQENMVTEKFKKILYSSNFRKNYLQVAEISYTLLHHGNISGQMGELHQGSKMSPYNVNILLAGYDKETGPSLYYIDYLATLHKVDKGAFGYGSFFSLSTMDRYYHSAMSVDEAIELVDKCINEIRSRLVIAPPNFLIKIVDKDGAREYAWRKTVKDAEITAVPVAVPDSGVTAA